jgi:hypothetical protein
VADRAPGAVSVGLVHEANHLGKTTVKGTPEYDQEETQSWHQALDFYHSVLKGADRDEASSSYSDLDRLYRRAPAYFDSRVVCAVHHTCPN